MVKLSLSVCALACGMAIAGCSAPSPDPWPDPGLDPTPADSTAFSDGSSSRATADDWRGQTVSRTEELLAGRFPGVQVFQTAGGISVRIRGTSSIMGNTQPLYVVDGMPLEPSPSGLLALNPSDIARIEVLKDIGQTSLYGVRGANGVILITTKRH